MAARRHCHLGVMQVGTKVTWTDQEGTHLGRVKEVAVSAGVWWARVVYLPLTATERLAWIRLDVLERVAPPAHNHDRCASASPAATRTRRASTCWPPLPTRSLPCKSKRRGKAPRGARLGDWR